MHLGQCCPCRCQLCVEVDGGEEGPAPLARSCCARAARLLAERCCDHILHQLNQLCQQSVRCRALNRPILHLPLFSPLCPRRTEAFGKRERGVRSGLSRMSGVRGVYRWGAAVRTLLVKVIDPLRCVLAAAYIAAEGPVSHRVLEYVDRPSIGGLHGHVKGDRV